MKTVRLVNNQIVEIFNETLEELSEKFSPTLMSMLEETNNDSVKIGWTKNEGVFEAPPSVVIDIDELKTETVRLAFGHMDSALENAVANVTINGTSYSFGCDKDSRENIMGVCTAIAIGLPIPNPRPWTPKGSLIPVSCSHSDLAAIGGLLLAKKDEYMQVYFTHKYLIMSANTIQTVQSYDYTTGYT